MLAKNVVPFALALLLAGCGSKDPTNPAAPANAQKGDKKGGKSAPTTPEAADEEFRVAASHKGEREQAAAKMLVNFRKDDKWSWERLEGEVNFQFQEIKDEFGKWKRDRVAAGDRSK